MWHAEFTRKELIELCLGGYDPRRMRAEASKTVSFSSHSSRFHAYWHEDPETAPGLPGLIVTPDGEVQDFLNALNASPQAPVPFTALCRVLSREEAEYQFNRSLFDVDEAQLRAIAILSMAEAVLHSEGKFSLRTLGPAACRRTVAYAWARACATGAPAFTLDLLVNRWLETYALMGHSQSSMASVVATIESVLEVLGHTRPLGEPRAEGFERRAKIVRALLAPDERNMERAWEALASELHLDASLKEIATASREERGGLLQQALRVVAASGSESAAVGCAFLATQVAPKSLEHLEILRSAGRPDVVLWYAFLAAIQAPLALLSGYGGLGFRVLRDIKRADDEVSPPTADVAYQELKTISRTGIDAIARRLRHVGEIEVELIPFASTTFSFPMRSARHEGPERQERDASLRVGLSEGRRARIYDALNAIAKLIEDTPEEIALSSPQAPTRRSYRKKGA